MARERRDTLQNLARSMGHEFAQLGLLDNALTHASISMPERPDNQRLEFLGDRVLGLVIAEALCAIDESAPEGELAPRLNYLVCKETCAEIAAELALGDAIRMGRSEMLSGGRRKMAILGDAMEAVIAAVYLDGGLEAARQLILRAWGSRVESAETRAADPKSELQHWAQARGQTPPAYVELDREGPAHAPVFTIEARLQSGQSTRAQARSKRAAEQKAARLMLQRLEADDG